jgi:predicted transcriptional regulator
MALRRRARSPRARESEQIIPEAEMEVLAVVHARGEVDARHIRQALEPFRPLSHASVLTLLGRLEERGLVTRRKADAGKAFVYSAARSPRPMMHRLLRRLVTRLFANDPSRLIASLFEAKPPSSAELEEIRRLVAAMEARK